jgi:hypothetical protein
LKCLNQEVNEHIKNLSDNEIKMLCDEIYDWIKYGTLNRSSKTVELYSSYEGSSGVYSAYDIEEAVVSEAYHRFNKLVNVLLKKRSSSLSI